MGAMTNATIEANEANAREGTVVAAHPGYFLLNEHWPNASEIMALSTGEEFKAAVRLWCLGWKQVPAGSLPNDETLLARFSGNTRRWKAIRAMALRGFILCADNRLYHKTLCEDVLRAWTKKLERREQTRAATEARKSYISTIGRNPGLAKSDLDPHSTNPRGVWPRAITQMKTTKALNVTTNVTLSQYSTRQ